MSTTAVLLQTALQSRIEPLNRVDVSLLRFCTSRFPFVEARLKLRFSQSTTALLLEIRFEVWITISPSPRNRVRVRSSLSAEMWILPGTLVTVPPATGGGRVTALSAKAPYAANSPPGMTVFVTASEIMLVSPAPELMKKLASG